MILLVETILLLLSFWVQDAHAYIDPNTGGYVFQWLFPIFSAIAAFFMFFRTAARKLFVRIFTKKGNGKKDHQEEDH